MERGPETQALLELSGNKYPQVPHFTDKETEVRKSKRICQSPKDIDLECSARSLDLPVFSRREGKKHREREGGEGAESESEGREQGKADSLALSLL
jgi:hypothetical protein